MAAQTRSTLLETHCARGRTRRRFLGIRGSGRWQATRMYARRPHHVRQVRHRFRVCAAGNSYMATNHAGGGWQEQGDSQDKQRARCGSRVSDASCLCAQYPSHRRINRGSRIARCPNVAETENPAAKGSRPAAGALLVLKRDWPCAAALERLWELILAPVSPAATGSCVVSFVFCHALCQVVT
jgi:hypothetical protein